jgi:hypothetical protein
MAAVRSMGSKKRMSAKRSEPDGQLLGVNRAHSAWLRFPIGVMYIFSYAKQVLVNIQSYHSSVAQVTKGRQSGLKSTRDCVLPVHKSSMTLRRSCWVGWLVVVGGGKVL